MNYRRGNSLELCAVMMRLPTALSVRLHSAATASLASKALGAANLLIVAWLTPSLRARPPTRHPSWAGFAVAVGLRAGLPRLLLIGEASHWRPRSDPPAAAKPAPCGSG